MDCKWRNESIYISLSKEDVGLVKKKDAAPSVSKFEVPAHISLDVLGFVAYIA